MLVLPQVGMARSVEPEHKVELDALVRLDRSKPRVHQALDFISGSDIVDVLSEEEIYESQELAHGNWLKTPYAELHRQPQILPSQGSPLN